MALSPSFFLPSVSLSHTLSSPLSASLYSQESGSDIWCRSVPLLITEPITDMPSRPQKKKKNPVHRPTNPRPVQPAPCRWKPTLCLPLSLSLSLSLGQNNNEPTGPRLNRSRRRIMTWTFFLSHSTGRAYHWPTYTQDHHQAPGLPVLRQEEAPAWTPHSLQWTAAKIKGGGKCI